MHPALTKMFGLCIAGCLISIAIWQIRILRAFMQKLRDDQKLAKRDKSYLLHQSFRRLQMHVMLGLAGIFMLIGLYLPVPAYPLLWAIVWFAIIILMCWAILLALVDYISIRLHFSRFRTENQIEKIRIDYEINKLRDRQDKSHVSDESEKEDSP